MVLEGDCSEEVPVTSGVPQGSILGPILFLIYINDLPDKVKSQVRLFADDTAAYLAISKLADSEQLQADLDILQEWEIRWDMQFNPSKCQVIHITRSRSPLQTTYTLHGETLEAVASARYLGVDIANDLSWKTHVSRITNNANKSLGSPYLACNDRNAFFTSEKPKKYHAWSCQNVCDALTFLLDNIFIRFGTKLYRQVVGISMGTNCAPLVADLFLFCYERDFMMSLSDDKQADVIDAFNTTSRYLDDILNINNVYFDNMVSQIYTSELQLNKANASDT